MPSKAERICDHRSQLKTTVHRSRFMGSMRSIKMTFKQAAGCCINLSSCNQTRDALIADGHFERGLDILEQAVLSAKCWSDILAVFVACCKKMILSDLSLHCTDRLLRHYSQKSKHKPNLKYVRKCVVCIEHFLKCNRLPFQGHPDIDPSVVVAKLFQVIRYHYWCNQSQKARRYLFECFEFMKQNSYGFEKHSFRVSFWLLLQLGEFEALNDMMQYYCFRKHAKFQIGV